MLDGFGPVAYQECNGKYRLVRALVEEMTRDTMQQDHIYQALFRYGGRCDCTVDRNVVRVPAHMGAVEEELRKMPTGKSGG